MTGLEPGTFVFQAQATNKIQKKLPPFYFNSQVKRKVARPNAKTDAKENAKE